LKVGRHIPIRSPGPLGEGNPRYDFAAQQIVTTKAAGFDPTVFAVGMKKTAGCHRFVDKMLIMWIKRDAGIPAPATLEMAGASLTA
jgi:hypothetical protein